MFLALAWDGAVACFFEKVKIRFGSGLDRIGLDWSFVRGRVWVDECWSGAERTDTECEREKRREREMPTPEIEQKRRAAREVSDVLEEMAVLLVCVVLAPLLPHLFFQSFAFSFLLLLLLLGLLIMVNVT